MSGAISFDFATREYRELSLEQALSALSTDRFLWVNITSADSSRAEEFRELLQVSNPYDGADEDVASPRFTDLGNCIYFCLQDIDIGRSRISMTRAHVYFGESFMLTIHGSHGDANFINSAFEDCHRNFQQVARSPGFLLFELADHMTQAYTRTVQTASRQTAKVESDLCNIDADDVVFAQVADLTRNILSFHKLVVAAREVVHDLATRLSPFIPETTQPFLEKKAALLDRLSIDVTTEREILSESLNLHMGMVTLRTNHVVTRLTILSTFFMPLGFVAAVYGMNFRAMPELNWEYGYVTFWSVVGIIVISLIRYMKFQKWL